LVSPKRRISPIDTEKKPTLFVTKAFSNEKIQEDASMRPEFFPPYEIFQTLERKWN